MPPKPKTKLFPSVRVTEELYAKTAELADQSGEYLSEYIRKAAEERNAQYVRIKANPEDWKYITGHVGEKNEIIKKTLEEMKPEIEASVQNEMTKRGIPKIT